jgi:hypothetical protein
MSDPRSDNDDSRQLQAPKGVKHEIWAEGASKLGRDADEMLAQVASKLGPDAEGPLDVDRMEDRNDVVEREPVVTPIDHDVTASGVKKEDWAQRRPGETTYGELSEREPTESDDRESGTSRGDDVERDRRDADERRSSGRE